jgi:mono/diheme cytochrome c family protein
VSTYEIAGKQYVAMASGNISRNAFGDVGLPSVVIMTLNPEAPSRQLDITSQSSDGRQLYSQVCTSCHGVDGNFISDHRLGDIASRMSLDEVIEKVKNPVAPMPALYPAVIDDATVEAVARFVHENF